MNNRKRANKITLTIMGILIAILIFIFIFPAYVIGMMLIIGAILGLYYMSKTLRNLIEETLDENDKNAKWKQDKNIK
jgi:uncharacterized membrane protein